MENKKNKVYKIIMLVVLTAFVTFMVTAFSMYSYFNNTSLVSMFETVSSQENSENSSKSTDLEKYLKRIKSTINRYYLWNDQIDEEKLKEGAIKGYVEGLGDEYTEYIPAEEMEDYTENITGNFVGIGIYMIADKDSGRVVVYYPIPESPAEKAGVKAGDQIISVDGTEYTADDFNTIADYIKGEEGTTVNLEVERNGERIKFEIKREKINTNPITIEMLENNIGYLKLPSFDEDTSKDFEEKVKELQSQGAQSLVIDLRNNGGGIVSEATDIADMLLDKGQTIISTVDKDDKKEITYSKKSTIFTMPITVLVNENSASASEILACSLKDNERAKIIGTKTYGKGIIQTLLSLTDGSGLKITTEEYYTPKGTTIHKVGIDPDEEVKLPDTVKSIYSVTKDEDTQLKKAIEILKNNE
jgi:carboxyl-terminal processing protease